MAIFGALCPVCMGCGKTSLDQFGMPVPQPTWASADTTAQGWTTCARCQGSGMVITSEPDCFGRPR